VRRQKLYIVAQAHPSNSSFRKKQRQRQIKEKCTRPDLAALIWINSFQHGATPSKIKIRALAKWISGFADSDYASSGRCTSL
jgi:hypothetical protein